MHKRTIQIGTGFVPLLMNLRTESENIMKRIALFILIGISGIFYTGCQKNSFYVDHTPPSVPTGVLVDNGDNMAIVSWISNRESDVAGYNIYSSSSYYGKYVLIGSTKKNYFTDTEVRNGYKYYYAVTAYNYNNDESAFSYESAYAAPRPEGFNETIFDYHRYPDLSGYSFAAYSAVPYTGDLPDFYFDYDTSVGRFYLDVYSDTDIKDMGPTSSIYDIAVAPLSGWSTTGDAEAFKGHTYVIWTKDNHFAKIRISDITTTRVIFDWAYQTIKGEETLKVATKQHGQPE